MRVVLISPDTILIQKFDKTIVYDNGFPAKRHLQTLPNCQKESHSNSGVLTQVSNQSTIIIRPDMIPGRTRVHTIHIQCSTFTVFFGYVNTGPLFFHKRQTMN